MALVFMDGFDHYAYADITRKWTAKWGTENSYGYGDLTTGRLGGSALLQHSAAGVNSTPGVVYTMPTSSASGVAGVAFKAITHFTFSDMAPLFAVFDGGYVQLWFRIHSDGTISVYRANFDSQQFVIGYHTQIVAPVASGIQLGVWAYLEFKWSIANSGGMVGMRVNGNSIINATGLDTQYTANAYATSVAVSPRIQSGSGGQDVAFDDFYLLNAAAGLTDYLGDVRVDAHYPNANGTTGQWTRSTGADQYATVDEAQANETDYNYTSVVGNKDTLGVENFKNPNATIYAVQTNLWAKKTDAGAGSISPVVRTGGADRDGTSVPLSTDWADSRQVYEHDPATDADWVEADFNGAEFGYKKRA